MRSKTQSVLLIFAAALLMLAPIAFADSAADCSGSSFTADVTGTVDFGQIPDWMNVKTNWGCPSCQPVSCFTHQDCANSCWAFDYAFCRNGTCAFGC